MKVIKDENLALLPMIPILHQYGIKKCGLKGCRENAVAIILEFSEGTPPFGMCAVHYSEAERTKRLEGTVEF